MGKVIKLPPMDDRTLTLRHVAAVAGRRVSKALVSPGSELKGHACILAGEVIIPTECGSYLKAEIGLDRVVLARSISRSMPDFCRLSL